MILVRHSFLLLIVAKTIHFQEFFTDGSDYENDVAFSENGTIILASRFVFQARGLANIDESRFVMISLRELFASDEFREFNLTSYNPLYKFGEQVIISNSISSHSILSKSSLFS